jgi:3-methyladenine DNA glycosylase AlkC
MLFSDFVKTDSSMEKALVALALHHREIARGSLVFVGQVNKAIGAPRDYQPVPGSKHDGFRKMVGGKWDYWYPSEQHAKDAATHHEKEHKSAQKKLGKLLRKKGASQEAIEAHLDRMETHEAHSKHAKAAHDEEVDWRHGRTPKSDKKDEKKADVIPITRQVSPQAKKYSKAVEEYNKAVIQYQEHRDKHGENNEKTQAAKKDLVWWDYVADTLEDKHPELKPEKATRAVEKKEKPEEKEEKKAVAKSLNTFLDLLKGGPYIGPRGGKWADPRHKIPWTEERKKTRLDKVLEFLKNRVRVSSTEGSFKRTKDGFELETGKDQASTIERVLHKEPNIHDVQVVASGNKVKITGQFKKPEKKKATPKVKEAKKNEATSPTTAPIEEAEDLKGQAPESVTEAKATPDVEVEAEKKGLPPHLQEKVDAWEKKQAQKRAGGVFRDVTPAGYGPDEPEPVTAPEPKPEPVSLFDDDHPFAALMAELDEPEPAPEAAPEPVPEAQESEAGFERMPEYQAIHDKVVARSEMQSDGRYTLWERVIGTWAVSRTLGGGHIKGDDDYWSDIKTKASSTRPVAFFDEGVNPNDVAEDNFETMPEAESEAEPLYEYGAYHRPVATSSTPDRNRPDDPTEHFGTHPDFKHGTVRYTKPLTPTQAHAMGLSRILIQKDIAVVVDKIAAEESDFAQAMLEEHDEEGGRTSSLETAVKQYIRDNALHVDSDMLIQRVADKLRESVSEDNFETMPEAEPETEPGTTLDPVDTALADAADAEKAGEDIPAVTAEGKLVAVGDHIWGSRKDLAGLGRIESSADLENMSYDDAVAIVRKSRLVEPLDLETAKSFGMSPGTTYMAIAMLAAIRQKPGDSVAEQAAYVDEIRQIQGALKRIKTLDDFQAFTSEMRAENRAGKKWEKLESNPQNGFRDRQQAQNHLDELQKDNPHAPYGIVRQWGASTMQYWVVEKRAKPFEVLGRNFTSFLNGKKIFNEAYTQALTLDNKWDYSIDEGGMTSEQAWSWLEASTKEKKEKKEVRKKPSWGETKRGWSGAKTVAGEVERIGGKTIESASAERTRETFNLREVDYGKQGYMTQSDREYHTAALEGAMHDFADAIGVDPTVMSFNGRLGIAMGARGRGKAAAHYETGRHVINITKFRGGGSLAHEWGHAMDNIVADHFMGSPAKKLARLEMLRERGQKRLDETFEGKETSWRDNRGMTRAEAQEDLIEVAVVMREEVSAKAESERTKSSYLSEAPEHSDLPPEVSQTMVSLMHTLTKHPDPVRARAEHAERLSILRTQKNEFITKNNGYVQGVKNLSRKKTQEQLDHTIEQYEGWIAELKEGIEKLPEPARGRTMTWDRRKRKQAAIHRLEVLEDSLKRYQAQGARTEQDSADIAELRDAIEDNRLPMNRAVRRYNLLLSIDPTDSDFAKSAKVLGAKYWGSSAELFARAFESYVEDKLSSSGRKSTYLVDGTTINYPTNKEVILDVQPYPQGDERKAMNAEFDKLMEMMRSSGHLQKAMEALFEWQDTDTEKAQSQPYHGTGVRGGTPGHYEYKYPGAQAPKPSLHDEEHVGGIKMLGPKGSWLFIHRSSKQPGMWQASFFDRPNPVPGRLVPDTQHKSLQEALKVAEKKGFQVDHVLRKGSFQLERMIDMVAGEAILTGDMRQAQTEDTVTGFLKANPCFTPLDPFAYKQNEN